MECARCHSQISPASSFCPRCGAPVEGASARDDYAYEAFISYRHDPRDAELARRVQRQIEGFRLPHDLKDKREGGRLGKCFRDKDELHSSDSLPALIEEALRRSRFLIVICSPAMRESSWVEREVELFASYHGRDKILLALADGEPEESFPPLLMTRLEPAWTVTQEKGDAPDYVERPSEPLAADLRNSSRRHVAAEMPRILAPIIGCSYDDLRQRMRARRFAHLAVAAAITAAASIAFGSFALFQQAQIQENYAASLKNQSEYLATEASTLLEEGDRLQAIQVALHALGENDGAAEGRPYTPSARFVLEDACRVYPGSYWQPVYSNYEDESFLYPSVVVSENGRWYAVITADYDVHVYDVATGERTCAIVYDDPESGGRACWDVTFANDLVVSTYSYIVLVSDAATGEPLHRVPLNQPDAGSYDYSLIPEHVRASPDGSVVAVTSVDTSNPEHVMVTIVETETGTVTTTVDIPSNAELGDSWLSLPSLFTGSFSPSGETFVQALGDTFAVIDVASGACTVHEVDSGLITGVVAEDEGIFIAAFEEREINSQYVIAMHDWPTLDARWELRVEARQDLGTANILGIDIITPLLTHVTEHEGARYFAFAYDDRIYYPNIEDGSIALEVKTEGVVTAIASGSDGALCYVSDGRIYTPHDAFGIHEATLFGATGARPPSGPSTWFGEPEVSADTAHIFTDDDGRPFCLFVDGAPYRTVLFRCDVDHELLPNREETSKETADALSSSYVLARSTSRSYSVYYETSDATLHILDGETLEVSSTVDISPYLINETDGSTEYVRTCAFAEGRGDIFYLSFSNNVLIAVDASTGAVVAETRLSEHAEVEEDCMVFQEDAIFYLEYERDYFGDDSHLWLVTLDARTLEETSRLELGRPGDASNQGSPWAMVISDSVIAIHSTVPSVPEWHELIETFDRATGEPVASDLSKVELDEDAAVTIRVLHGGEDRIALCHEELLQLFDSNGSKLWEQQVECRYFPHLQLLPTGDLFFLGGDDQAAELLDGETGERIATTMRSDLPSIEYSWISDDGTTLYAQASGSIYAVSLDPESFDVESYILCGKAISTDWERVLIVDDYNAYTLPLYATDELVDYAKGLIAGHELTDAQRRLYHLV